MNISAWFADVELDEVILEWQKLPPQTRDALLIIGALLLATLGAFIWAAFLRRRRKRRQGHSHGASHRGAQLETATKQEETPKRRKWRRRRREHRPRNPTLAETGGLPPVRTDGFPDTRP
jgi:hypothetical protein